MADKTSDEERARRHAAAAYHEDRTTRVDEDGVAYKEGADGEWMPMQTHEIPEHRDPQRPSKPDYLSKWGIPPITPSRGIEGDVVLGRAIPG